MTLHVTGPTPPDWLAEIVQAIMKSANSEDPMHAQAWLHEDDSDAGAWHVDVLPTVLEEDGGSFVNYFSIHLSPIIKLLDPVEVMADLNSITLSGRYKDNPVHLVFHLGPDEDDDEEEADEASPEAEAADKASLN